MVVLRGGDTIEVHAPAKLNLFLELLARRPDGFHELETLMVPVSIYDTLLVRSLSSPEIRLESHWTSGLFNRLGSSLGDLPPAESNIVFKAAKLLQEVSGTALGLEIVLTKRIPSQAGLGGASSDAAATLVAANLAWQLEWSREQLAMIAGQLGSDVPFFLFDGAAMCRGRGELIAPLGPTTPLHVVVVRPPEGISTPQVYRRCTVPENPVAASASISAILAGDPLATGRALVNRLQAPAAEISPWIGRMSEAFSRTDCLGHQMSGSGSSYYGICRNARHARRLAAQLEAARLGYVMCSIAGGAA